MPRLADHEALHHTCVVYDGTRLAPAAAFLDGWEATEHRSV
ncbi:hypothetical protein ACIQVL_50975 [Streptomyces sp. NPDC090499]